MAKLMSMHFWLVAGIDHDSAVQDEWLDWLISNELTSMKRTPFNTPVQTIGGINERLR